MIPQLFKKMAMLTLIVSLAFAACGCAALPQTFTKAPPTSDNSWMDLEGGFPQH